MDIYKLYAQKKEEYNDYQIKLGVYKSHVADAMQNLQNTLTALGDIVPTIRDTDIKDLFEQYYAKAKSIDLTSITDQSVFDATIAELTSISATIEAAIRGKLDEV